MLSEAIGSVTDRSIDELITAVAQERAARAVLYDMYARLVYRVAADCFAWLPAMRDPISAPPPCWPSSPACFRCVPPCESTTLGLTPHTPGVAS